ncbi:hypothetical protein K2Z83_26840 [Oscillochloris sp. ZM17-4]|uniref:hypothetical protein n=1 Tax=Oscillochloris sp. ZM17-4 TaxID=2866714 RepID=UPI001C72E2CC|nr:hypothetical protein [Oscillochloris sp. ZM17-4]MBX0331271.1 hypothetical protein [Oscillochloris sp. ZM17-4]
MAQNARPRPRRSRAGLRELVALFVVYAARPFEPGPLPNWYIYSSFVLLLICLGSVALNIALIVLFALALLP